MGIFRIHKQGTRNFWHTFDTKTDQEFSDWNININHQAQTIILTMPNGATFPRLEVEITDVRVKVLTGSDETFATTELLRARLVEIGYNPLVATSISGSQNLQEVLTIGGRGIKEIDTTLGNYTLETEDKALALILVGDTEIDIIVPTTGFVDGDTIPIYNPNGTANANFDITAVDTFSEFNPILPSYKAELICATVESVIAWGISYESNGLEGGGGIPDAPNDVNAYVRSALSWVIGYTKSAIDTLLNLKANLISPTFTGTPQAPTPSANDNSTKIATTAYVDAKKDYASVTCWHLANTFSDSTSYFFGVINQVATTTSDLRRRFYAPFTGQIVTVHAITNATTPTSAQDVSLKINNLTAVTSVTVGAIRFDNSAFVFNFTGLSFAVSENDALEFELVVPALTTNGTACTTTCQVTFKK